MVSDKYVYNVYGLLVESDIEIKEFCKAQVMNKDNKVKMHKTIISDEIKSKIHDKINVCMRRNEVWFNVENIAIYQICNGNEINFEPYENADMNLVKIYLTCSCLGIIMLQQGKVSIHGGCVIMKDKAFIITGERGAGKSTLTTALRLRGYKFLADDVVGINEKNGLKADYGFPYQKLCDDVMENFGYDKSKYQSIMGDSQVKYMVPVYDDFCEKSIGLSAIFEINSRDIESVEVEEVKGHEKLERIISNIYRGEHLQNIGGMSAEYMKKCFNIAKHIKYYKIYRPNKKFSLDEEICAIENILLS